MAKGVIKKLISQQPSDCLPFIPLIYSYAARLMQVPVRKMLTNPTLLTKSISMAYELFHPDVLVFPVDETLEAEALGAAVRYSSHAAPLIEQPALSSLDLPNEPVETHLQKGRLPLTFETLKRLKEQLGREVDLLAGVTGPLTLAFQLRGKGLREDFLSNQQEAMTFLEFVGQFITRIIRSYGELGVAGILLVESRFSWVGLEMLSFLKSLIMPICNTCSYYEVPVIFYPDGIPSESRDFIADLPWQGFIVNKPLEQGKLLKELSAKSRFVGLPLASDLLINQPEATLLKDLEDFIPIGAACGYFITTEGDLPLKIPAENIHYIRKCLNR